MSRLLDFRVSSVALLLAAAVPALAAEGTSPEQLLRHIKELASDAYEGRGPGSPGEDKTVAYLSAEFAKAGAQPGNPDGTWVQSVPLLGVRSTPTMSLAGCASGVSMASPDEYVAWTTQVKPEVNIKDSELVFVGYGVQAPEYGWDDYKGVDVRGKTLVMLINDPAIPDPKDASKLDDKMFKGKAMTYYGRWTYKYEIAAKLGAAGAIIVHETIPAAYPYDVVRNNGLNENMTLKASDGNAGHVGMRSWFREDKARAVLSACGQDFDALKKAALKKDFKPVVLAAKVNVAIKNQLREVQSRNVVARIEGGDPKRKHEHVLYTAHWDHLGKAEDNGKVQIFNGAVDNASGTAALLELARQFAAQKKSLKRSVMFVAVTAEEKGLLGSHYYANNPLYPLKDAVANLNMDAMQPWGKTSDVQIIGSGQTNMDDWVTAHAKGQGRTVMPDDKPENGYYFRSDHFPLAQQGVPALYLKGGVQLRDHPGVDKSKEYTVHDYHKDSDEVKADWDLRGMAEDVDLYFAVGRDLARDLKNADFSDGSEFKAARQHLLAK